jgi:hypothetical protein
LLVVLPFFAAVFFEVERVEDNAIALDDRFAADFAEAEVDFVPARVAFVALVVAFCAPVFELPRFTELLPFALTPAGAGLARFIF